MSIEFSPDQTSKDAEIEKIHNQIRIVTVQEQAARKRHDEELKALARHREELFAKLRALAQKE